MAAAKIYDLVVLGATGFTGQFVLEEVLRETAETQGFRLAVAGRSKDRLEAGLDTAQRRTGGGPGGAVVAVEVVDVTNEDAVKALAAKTKVLLSCVGPFRRFGLPVVRACVSGGADFLDISGEPQYLEEVQATLGAAAREAGVYVVGSCGFDSVPADMGTVFLQDNFPGELASVEMVVGHGSIDGSSSPSIHATTLECAVLGYANRHKLRENRRKILDKSLPLPPNRPPKRGMLWRNASGAWCVNNIGSDRSVVARSQQLLFVNNARPPVHFTAYFSMPSLAAALGAVMFGVVFVIMTACRWTRSLLIKHPSLFTAGMFSWAGPRREELSRQNFSMRLTGRGWRRSAAAVGTESTGGGSDQKKRGPPDLVKTCMVVGPDPGYFGTATIVVQCALTILYEKHLLPAGGGVFTPASAFLRTNLIRNLQKRGIVFSITD